MRRDFEITNAIYLVQSPHELDLHNNFDFQGLHYSVEDRTLLLRWRRSKGEWVASGTPASVCVEFREVSEFRFQPRDAELPFTEDDCVSTFGYWTDEDWADGVIVVEPSQTPNPKWLTAISFMSGAVIAVQAASAYARIEA
jgi:hypothetical protein